MQCFNKFCLKVKRFRQKASVFFIFPSSPQADLCHFSSPLRCPNQIPNLNHQTTSNFGYSSYQDQVLTTNKTNRCGFYQEPRSYSRQLQAPAVIASVRISSYEILCCRRIFVLAGKIFLLIKRKIKM